MIGGEVNADGVIVLCRNASDDGVNTRRINEAVATEQYRNSISNENPVLTPFISPIALCFNRQLEMCFNRWCWYWC